MQRVRLRAGIAEGDVFQPQLVFPVRTLRQGLAALHAEGLRQLEKFTQGTELETLPPQRAELGENAVELLGIRADGGEAQQKVARAHSPGERLAQQEVIGKAVSHSGEHGVDHVRPEIHPLAPLDEGVDRAERFIVYGFEPRAHAENADVLAENGAPRLVGNIVHFLFERGGLVAVTVAPLVDAPVDEILRRGRHGERGEKPYARIREQQQIHYKAQRRGEKLLLIHPERLARAAVIYGRAYGLLLQLENFRVLGERIGHHAGLIMDLADERKAHIDSREHRRVLQIGADRRTHEQQRIPAHRPGAPRAPAAASRACSAPDGSAAFSFFLSSKPPLPCEDNTIIKLCPRRRPGTNRIFPGMNRFAHTCGSSISVVNAPSSLLRERYPSSRATISSMRTRPKPCPSPFVVRKRPPVFSSFFPAVKFVKEI